MAVRGGWVVITDMSRLLALAFAFPVALVAAAPTSIADRVYHAKGGIVRSRAVWESIIIFGPEGRYSYLKSAFGSAVSNPSVNLLAPPADGTYSYVRTSDTTARLTLADPTGTLVGGPTNARTTSLTIDLSFEDLLHGGWNSNGGGGRFYLTDTTTASRQPLVNVALRANVAPNRAAIVGFVVPSTSASRRTDLLIRVVGPSLALFGVTGAWQDPDFDLVIGPSGSDTHLRDWAATTDGALAVQKISAHVGAFPLPSNSKDAVAVVSVIPGPYTITCSAVAGDPGGEVLIEIYTLP